MALPYPEIRLKKGKEKSVLNFHPWIFSGALEKMPAQLKNGDAVTLLSHDGEILGTGLFHHSSIAVRLLAFSKVELNVTFWIQKLSNALQLRKNIHLFNNKETTAYRLVHGEGDGLSGLIIDIYGDCAVIQCHIKGMFNHRYIIAEALNNVFNQSINTIYDKSEDSFFENNESRFLKGEKQSEIIKENGHRFYVNWFEGQKTGFFIDQRENRKLLSNYCDNKNVINLFAYSGGFSIYALKSGASLVHSVDSSSRAENWANQNVQLNDAVNHQFFCEDVFTFLKETKNNYQVWVVDPPAFAKRLDAVRNAMIGYRNLNTAVFRKASPGSIIFTFSCSQAVDALTFRKVIFQSAKEAQRQIKVLHILSQPADHPVSVFHPEGEYLKGLVLYVE